jgi:methyl-accepting chemotaxis protein
MLASSTTGCGMAAAGLPVLGVTVAMTASVIGMVTLLFLRNGMRQLDAALATLDRNGAETTHGCPPGLKFTVAWRAFEMARQEVWWNRRLADELMRTRVAVRDGSVGFAADLAASISTGSIQIVGSLKNLSLEFQTGWGALGTSVSAIGQETSNTYDGLTASWLAASEAASGTSSVVEAIEESTRQIVQSASDANEISQRTVEAEEMFQQLRSQVSEIGDVTRMIRSIADQTNLLALNATIEAARAGEAGRGFAVVASEVKTLSNRTAAATIDIAGRIATVEASVQLAVTAIHDIAAAIHRVKETVTATASTMQKQSVAVNEVAGASARAEDNSLVALERLAALRVAMDDNGLSIGSLHGTIKQMSESIELVEEHLVAVRASAIDHTTRQRPTRYKLALPCSIDIEGEQIAAMTDGISAGGVKLRQEARLHVGQSCQIGITGLPHASARVMEIDGDVPHLMFIFSGAQDEQAMVKALEELNSANEDGPMRKAAFALPEAG